MLCHKLSLTKDHVTCLYLKICISFTIQFQMFISEYMPKTFYVIKKEIC